MQPYCSASYLVNTDNKLELKVKRCENELALPDCYNSTECHIDNQLNDDVNKFHFCCCGDSYCNQNISFTHPTEHSEYGKLLYIFTLYTMYIPLLSYKFAWIGE